MSLITDGPAIGSRSNIASLQSTAGYYANLQGLVGKVPVYVQHSNLNTSAPTIPDPISLNQIARYKTSNADRTPNSDPLYRYYEIPLVFDAPEIFVPGLDLRPLSTARANTPIEWDSSVFPIKIRGNPIGSGFDTHGIAYDGLVQVFGTSVNLDRPRSNKGFGEQHHIKQLRPV